MGTEIEVKFLVDEKFLKEIMSLSESSQPIIQGYVRDSKGVRVRCVNNGGDRSACLTLKSKRDWLTRYEFEYDIPYDEGISIINKMCDNVILKTRYFIKNKKDEWEIDVFHKGNRGLIIAELEIPQEDYDISPPKWIEKWKEITDDDKYYNESLAKNPYKNWS